MLSTLLTTVVAVIRLLLVLLVTLYCTLRHLLAMAIFGKDGRATARRASHWGRWLCRVSGLKVERRGEPAPEGEAGVLYVANHRSYADIPALLTQTSAAFLAKAEVARWPVLGFAARVGNTVFVDREDRESRHGARARLGEALDSGLSVMVFPEGTSTAGPSFLPFRPGVFFLAAKLGRPVQPVAISYRHKEDAWVGSMTFVGHFLRRFGRWSMPVVVSFGPPLRGDDGIVLRGEAEAWIADELGRLRRSAAEGGEQDGKEEIHDRADRAPRPVL